MKIGRTLAEMSKAKTSQDYINRFLEVYRKNEDIYTAKYKKYFRGFMSFKDFADKHFLIGSYLSEPMEIDIDSNHIKEGKVFIYNVIMKM